MRRKRRKNRSKNPVSYQNKDITSKILASAFKGKSFEVYGIKDADIVDFKPTNLPAIQADELRLDGLFELSDGNMALVDYESSYSRENMIKYLDYLARVVRKLYNESGHTTKLRIIIIYTADVRRGQTEPELDLGCMRLKIEEAFLSDLEPVVLLKEIEEALEKQDISDEIMMKMIIYPLTFEKIELKRGAVTEITERASEIENQRKQSFVLSGIYTFADKIISTEDAEKIRRLLHMTKVEQIYTRERIEAVNKAVREADARARLEEKENTALKYLREGDSVEKVARCSELPPERVEELKRSLL